MKARATLPDDCRPGLCKIDSSYVNNCGRHQVSMALLRIFVANTHAKECPRPNIVSSQTERKEGERKQVRPFGSGHVTITALQH